MATRMPNGLRDYLRQIDPDLADSLDILWRLSQPIHDRQNRPDSNENGRHHVESVERNIWRFIVESPDRRPDTNLERFASTELFLLSAAACCHDFDKALGSALPPGFSVHGQGSADFLRANHERLGLDRPWADAVALTISIHDLKGDRFTDEVAKLKRNHRTPLGDVNMQRIAILLKTADILHTDFSRVSPVAIDVTRLDGMSKQKYLARYCIDGWGIDGSRVIIQATPSTDEQRDALHKAVDYMRENEWSCVAEYLKHLGFPYDLHEDRGEGHTDESSGSSADEFHVPPFPERLRDYTRKIKPLRSICRILQLRANTTIAKTDCREKGNRICGLPHASLRFAETVGRVEKASVDDILRIVDLSNRILDVAKTDILRESADVTPEERTEIQDLHNCIEELFSEFGISLEQATLNREQTAEQVARTALNKGGSASHNLILGRILEFAIDLRKFLSRSSETDDAATLRNQVSKIIADVSCFRLSIIQYLKDDTEKFQEGIIKETGGFELE